MATATFIISGMECAACALGNERTLKKISGVRKANVELGTGRAQVDYDERLVTESELRNAVAQNGYQARNLVSEPQTTLVASFLRRLVSRQ
jgi:cation transport ATPase